MAKIPYSKPPLLLADQVQNLLINRGLHVANPILAEHCLSNINYYRLSAYLKALQIYGDPTHRYRVGTSLEQAMNIYRFDRKLRLLIFDEIERIEIAVRTQLMYHFSLEYGANWYENDSLYRYSYQKGDFISILNKEFGKTTEIFIQHYFSNYDSPLLPPSWMALEIISLGQVSRLYKNLRSNVAKKAVANHFGVQEPVLESWLETLSFIRNVCAHHARLWNKKMPKPPMIPSQRNISGKWVSLLPDASKFNRGYLAFVIIRYLLQFIQPTSHFPQKLKQLLIDYPDVNNKSIGFPQNWETDTFWS